MYGGLHGEALPREAGGAARLPARLHGDAAGAAGGGAGEAGAPARGAPAQAAAAAAAGNADCTRTRRGTPGWTGRPALDLVVTLDDATSEIYSAILVEEEGTASSFRALAEVIARAGALLSALHRPRQPLLPHARCWRQASIAEHPTQVGRALDAARHRAHRRLLAAGARPLGARCSARWRTGCPRSWRWPGSPTSRPPTPGCARSTCRRTTPASRWPRRSRAAPSSRWPPEQWREVLCLQETRQVGNDNRVRWRDRGLQIPKSPLRPHFARRWFQMIDRGRRLRQSGAGQESRGIGCTAPGGSSASTRSCWCSGR